MRKFNKAFMPAYAKAMQLQGEHDLPERIVNKSLEVYKRLMIKQGTRGRSRAELVKACIMITAENLNYPLLIKEWRTKNVMKAKKHVNRLLKLKMRRVEAHMYASRIGYEVQLKEEEISKAIRLVKDEYGMGIACAALNKACGTSLRKLARITGLSRNYIWRLSKEFNNKNILE